MLSDNTFWLLVGAFGGIGFGVIIGSVCTLGAERIRRQRARWWHEQAPTDSVWGA